MMRIPTGPFEAAVGYVTEREAAKLMGEAGLVVKWPQQWAHYGISVTTIAGYRHVLREAVEGAIARFGVVREAV
ncbi:MAG: hypothetical protein E6Q97_17960 [Desulfurellales bacterium]|nr:MAG: hypothetical protein E6Q97_17960 [Desulfurellales bacterium]